MRVRPKRKRKVAIALAVVVIVVALLAGAAVYLQSIMPVAQPPAATPAEKPAPKPVSVSSNALFLGNIFWGRYVNDWSMASPLKTAYPFSRLNEFDRAKYDAWITGLECPTVAGFSQTSAAEDATLSFNCSPDYLPEAAKWFTVVTLANNHTDNRGADGFAETQRQLDKNGIQYFGNYDPDVLADICEVIAFPVKVTYDDKSVQEQSLPVALCGYHGVFKIPSQESLAVMEQYSKLMPVIAMPHMGLEYEPAPDQLKEATYRSMIDHGADMVIGDHPHWVQNTESYKGHLIVYSMGNFIFDQQSTSEVMRSAAINVLMNAKVADGAQLADWLKIGSDCKTFHDNCLAEIQAADLTKLPMQYQFGVIGTSDTNKITKPATADEQSGILQRLDWTNTMKQLQTPYSSL